MSVNQSIDDYFRNWYWIINPTDNQVFSSKTATFVPLTDPDYQAWLDQITNSTNPQDQMLVRDHGAPTVIGSVATLFTILQFNIPDIAEQAYDLLEPGLDIDQVFNHRLGKGLAITSTATPALDGTYAIDPVSQARYGAITAGITANRGVPGGGSTFGLRDQGGSVHAFTGAEFINLASAVETYVYGLYSTQAVLHAGGTADWPSAQVNIA